MKIFFWPAHMLDGCFRYRVDMQSQVLADRGHHVEVSQRMGVFGREEADIVVGQRVATPNPTYMWQLLAAEKREKGLRRLVYEIDDDLFNIDASNPLGTNFNDPAMRRDMAENIKVADLVTVSTQPLADSIRRFNRNVHVLPNGVRAATLERPLNVRRGVAGPVVVGWQGSATHRGDWATIQPCVASVMADHGEMRMRFLGTHYADGLDPRRTDFHPWTVDLDQHYRRVSRFDIGLAPLTDSLFNRAKSGLKFIEYAALGVPAICSDVPAYRSLVEHGVTGFLARTPEDWRQHLRALIADPAMRVEIGDAARRAAKAWTVEATIDRWVEAYSTLL